MIGQGKIKLRSDDPVYLELVDRWWNVLLPKIGPFLYKRGGNILMVQVCPVIPQTMLCMFCREQFLLLCLELQTNLRERAICYHGKSLPVRLRSR